MSAQTYDMWCAPETPRKVEFAGQGPDNKEYRLHSKATLSQKLLALPRFKSVDILDLISLAEEKCGTRVSDRASAIAVLVGTKALDSAEFQTPLTVAVAPGMPKYL
jgi:hypothetical protein